jgi:ABC-2 type transport system permease protein
MKFRRVRAVFRKELLHIVRDARSLYMALAIPMLLLLLFGYALTLDVDHIPTVIDDRDQSPRSRELVERFRASRYFEVRAESGDTLQRVDRGDTLLVVTMLAGFGRDIERGAPASVQLVLDGSDSNTASIALGYAEGMVAFYAAELRDEFANLRGAPKIKPPVEPRIRVLYNSELKSRNYIVPGLVAVILMIISALLTSLTIAREWETGTMEQLLSTPVRPAELVLGKLGAFFVVGVVDMVLSLLVGLFVFKVPLHGDLWLLLGTSFIFLFGALCWGLMISAALRNQLLAYQIGMITSFLPAFILSGFIYAIESMPALVQAFTYLIPARYFITITKGVFLKGVGLEVLWLEAVFLLLYAALVFWFATRKLRQKIA